MKEVKCPPAAEWDFRAVHESALPDAVLYEYARESPKIREAACRWLESDCGGKTTRAHCQTTQIAPASFFATGLPWPLYDLFEARPDFPAPWLTRPLLFKRNRGYSRVAVQTAAELADSLERLSAALAQCGKTMPAAGLLRLYHRPRFVLDIEWPDATVREIVKDFKRWLAHEAKRHPEMKRAGKRGQSLIEPLKWLAAYRLKQAGLAYREAQALLDVYLDPANVAYRNEAARLGVINIPRFPKAAHAKGKRQILPVFSDAAGWSTAISRAKRKLAELESGKLETWLLNVSP